MNCTLSQMENEVVINTDNLGAFEPGAFLSNDIDYATIPMPVLQPVIKPVVHPVLHQEDEEEVYTAFEQALNERFFDAFPQLRAQGNAAFAMRPLPQTDALALERVQSHNTSCSLQPLSASSQESLASESIAPTTTEQHALTSLWQQRITLIGFGLLCGLSGFDLMGWLMLHVR